MPQRWAVRKATPRVREPCLELRLREYRDHDGRTGRMLNLIDEHTRESLLMRLERRSSSAKVIEALADVIVIKGMPRHIR
jgi:hypothetical protein